MSDKTPCAEEKTYSEALVTDNMGLVHACANRFRGRGVEYEDLFQAGCVGLVKAAKGFDADMGYKFSTYAVPAILGEIKRIFRDGGSVKIGRTAKEKAAFLLSVRKELTDELGYEPGISLIAEKAGVETPEAARLISACLPAVSLTTDEASAQTDIPVKGPEDELTAALDLRSALKTLTEKERKMIELRFFRGLTQASAAEQLGMTQVQVSRKEKNILIKLRGMLE